jgi:hypothetical protein
MRHHLHASVKADVTEGESIMSEHASTGAKGSPRASVKVTLKENVSLDQLTKIISGIGGRYGCRTCGLMGVDLQLSGDPGDLPEIASLPGVKSASL